MHTVLFNWGDLMGAMSVQHGYREGPQLHVGLGLHLLLMYCTHIKIGLYIYVCVHAHTHLVYILPKLNKCPTPEVPITGLPFRDSTL